MKSIESIVYFQVYGFYCIKCTDYSLDIKYKSIQDIVKGKKSRTQIVNELGVPRSTKTMIRFLVAIKFQSLNQSANVRVLHSMNT